MAVIRGDDKDNVLIGTPGADRILGLGGDDELLGLDGDDHLDGGPGSDRIDGGPGFDTLVLHAGSFVLLSEGEALNDAFDPDSATEIDRFTGIEAVLGSRDPDTIFGTRGADEIDGGRGDDEIDGGPGNDKLYGGFGDDAVFAGQGRDFVLGGNGADALFGDRGDDHLDGQQGDDFLDGGEGNDRLAGGAGDDFLDGLLGNDRLLGGPGDDTLFGGRGDDHLEGGPGDDLVRPEAGDDRVVLGGGQDRVFLFFGEDVPEFESIDRDRIEGFGQGRHTLDIRLDGLLTDGRVASIDVRDFLDSNDDGRIDAGDAEVLQEGGGLLLDLDALMARALGRAGDFGTQEITLADVGGFAARQIAPAVEANETLTIPLVTEDGILEPPVTGDDLLA